LCAVRKRSLRRTDHSPDDSYRVWCVWVCSWIIDNEEALAHWGLLLGVKVVVVDWKRAGVNLHPKMQANVT